MSVFSAKATIKLRRCVVLNGNSSNEMGWSKRTSSDFHYSRWKAKEHFHWHTKFVAIQMIEFAYFTRIHRNYSKQKMQWDLFNYLFVVFLYLYSTLRFRFYLFIGRKSHFLNIPALYFICIVSKGAKKPLYLSAHFIFHLL